MANIAVYPPYSLTDPRGKPLWPSPFGVQRVSAPFALAEYVNKYDLDTLEYGTLTATGGTIAHVPAQSSIALAVTGTSASRALLRTHTFFRYQSGKAMRARMTMVHADTGQTNQSRRWGMFDDNNGVFFSLVGTTLGIVQRSDVSGSVVDTTVAKASWNFDKLDGTGPSGVTLDLTKLNIYEIAYQWLGAGEVQYFVNGYLVHETVNPNTLTVPYMRTGQLPLAWEVVNTGASTGSTMTYVCSHVSIDGGEHPANYTDTAFNATAITASTTERPVLSIRPKLVYGASNVVNRMLMLPYRLGLQCTGGATDFRLVVNPTSMTGASFASVGAQSGMEFDVAATAITGGQTLQFGPLTAAIDSSIIDLDKTFQYQSRGRKIRLDAFGSVQDTLVILATAAAGTTNARARIAWEEVR